MSDIKLRHNFQLHYVDSMGGVDFIEEKRIVDMLCKHILSLNSDRERKVYEASMSVGYNKCLWGYGENLHENYQLNRLININRIQRFIYNMIFRPVRVVRDQSDEYWIDNLHSAIMWVLILSEDAKLKDIPHYIVETNRKPWKIYATSDFILTNLSDINSMLDKVQDRLNRISPELYKINYTIGNFMTDNKISIDELTYKFNKDENWVKKFGIYYREMNLGK